MELHDFDAAEAGFDPRSKRLEALAVFLVLCRKAFRHD
jgi:hypothetical protein